MPRMKPNDIDRQIGVRIRRRRKDYLISLAALGAAIGVSGEQVHKYETGEDQITAPRLHHIARELDMPIEWFFE